MRRIFVGFACNNGCRFCAQADDRRANGSGAPVVPGLQAQLAEVVAGESVAFVGGEPTLHEQLPSWLGAARERGAARLLVQSNGRRFAYPGYAAGLVDASRGPLALDVSLQGSTREMHEHHTRVPGSFSQTVLGLRHARAAGIGCAVTLVMTRANYRHLGDVVRLVHAVGVRAIRLVEVEPEGAAAASSEPLAPPPEMLAPRLAFARETALRLGIELSTGALSADEARFAGPSFRLHPAALG